MDLRQLEHFVAVAEERHFTRAAERVHIVQSGLSSSVRSLEHELGVPLFERGKRGIELTQAGEALLPDARRALAAAQDGREAVGSVARLQQGRLTIGLWQVLTADASLAAVLAVFCRDHPRIEVRIQHGPPDVLGELRAGRLDLVITPISDPVEADLVATVIARDRMAVVHAPEHPLRLHSRVGLAELAGERFIDLPANTTTRSIVDRAFESAGMARQTVVEVDHISASLELVANGVGVAIVPSGAAPLSTRGVFLPLDVDLPWDLAVVRRASGPGGPAADLHRRLASLRPGHRRAGARGGGPDDHLRPS